MSANATWKANAICASTLLVSLFLAAVGLDVAAAQERFITLASATSAQCPSKDAAGTACGVYYADLRERSD
jgi:hypothetical protein